MVDSRNTASRSNKPIASQLAKGGGHGHKNIRISKSGDSDDDEDDDDAILAGGADLRSGEYGGKKAQGGLAQMKAKLSLQEELGALKSELSNFESSITKNSQSHVEDQEEDKSAALSPEK